MNSRPDFKDPWEAARVGSFMEPARAGRWKIVRFTVTERQATMSLMQAHAEGGTKEEREMRASRTIPPGTYLSLQRLATAGEIADIEDGGIVDGEAPVDDDELAALAKRIAEVKGEFGHEDPPGEPEEIEIYVPVMSDTPTEIREHYQAITDAEGDVVITGLGLGCIVSALLAKPEVKTITVVEIDKDVIALTGPYYENEPRVKIVNLDALAAARVFYAEGVYFDYAWHDIWSHIADRNLEDDDLAEHGISYETMFNTYSDVCDVQEAWAWREARLMRHYKEQTRARMKAWAAKFTAPEATYEDRVNLLVHFHVIQMLPGLQVGDEVPTEIATFVAQQWGIRERSEEQLRVRGEQAMVIEIAARAEQTLEGDLDPMNRPNEVPEANVAR